MVNSLEKIVSVLLIIIPLMAAVMANKSTLLPNLNTNKTADETDCIDVDEGLPDWIDNRFAASNASQKELLDFWRDNSEYYYHYQKSVTNNLLGYDNVVYIVYQEILCNHFIQLLAKLRNPESKKTVTIPKTANDSFTALQKHEVFAKILEHVKNLPWHHIKNKHQDWLNNRNVHIDKFMDKIRDALSHDRTKAPTENTSNSTTPVPVLPKSTTSLPVIPVPEKPTVPDKPTPPKLPTLPVLIKPQTQPGKKA